MANDHDLEKYSRQIILNEIGPEGQEKIKRVSILVIGAGGLGSSVIQYSFRFFRKIQCGYYRRAC